MDENTKKLYVFGYGLGVLFCLFAAISWFKHGLSIKCLIFFNVALIFVIMTRINVNRLKPLYKGWMKVSGLIGKVISTVVLSVVYYFVFGVISIVLRLLGKDLLRQKAQEQADTYWQKREQTPFNKEQYLKQF